MKFYPILFSIAALGLVACQSHPPKQAVSIQDEPKSIIQQWYGPNHFDSSTDEANCNSSQTQNSSNVTPAGNIFSKEFLDQKASNTIDVQESFFSHYLFRDATDVEQESSSPAIKCYE